MKTMIRAFYDFEKEENFLNKMAAQGWALKKYCFCKYVFEECEKGEYIYRIQLLEKGLDNPESQKYIQFMEDMGAEFITSYNRWVYFRKKASEGEFEIFTDKDSKISHYKKVRLFFMIAAGVNAYLGFLNFMQGNLNAYISILSFSLVAIFIIFLILPLTNKISSLEKDKEIHE